MSKYWENFNIRKLEELNRRKNEVIYIKQGIILKKDKDTNENKIKQKHIDNSVYFNIGKNIYHYIK